MVIMNQEEELNELLQVRRDKLNTLRERGLIPSAANLNGPIPPGGFSMLLMP